MQQQIIDTKLHCENYLKTLKKADAFGAPLHEKIVNFYVDDINCLHQRVSCQGQNRDVFTEIEWSLKDILIKECSFCDYCFATTYNFDAYMLNLYQFTEMLTISTSYMESLKAGTLTPSQGVNYFKCITDAFHLLSYRNQTRSEINPESLRSLDKWRYSIIPKIFEGYYTKLDDATSSKIMNAYLCEMTVENENIINSFAEAVSKGYEDTNLLITDGNDIFTRAFEDWIDFGYLKDEAEKTVIIANNKLTLRTDALHNHAVIFIKFLCDKNPKNEKAFIVPSVMGPFFSSTKIGSFTSSSIGFRATSLPEDFTDEMLEIINGLYQPELAYGKGFKNTHQTNINECVKVAADLAKN